MATPSKSGLEQHLFRITLSSNSNSVHDLDKVCSDVVKAAKEKLVRVKGPVRMPTKMLNITTRKSPCGQGTNTWDRFEMRVHKRVVDLVGSLDVIKQFPVPIPPTVHVEVTITDL
ncbi:40S ribosomal protein S20-like [Triticum dicoccoides]|uniref:40S ribosomal protein S20-like n=1 Tax=Triticum dicoccoides TaxID=85692 RepID=UPI00162CB55D|nr:40S ribosomal protein S20-like [Triticum dicoccoides]